MLTHAYQSSELVKFDFFDATESVNTKTKPLILGRHGSQGLLF